MLSIPENRKTFSTFSLLDIEDGFACVRQAFLKFSFFLSMFHISFFLFFLWTFLLYSSQDFFVVKLAES